MFIIGSGGHAKVILDMLLLSNSIVSGLWDDRIEKASVLGIPILGTIDELSSMQTSEKIIIAVGDNTTRKAIAKRLMPFSFANVIHPASIISKSCLLGTGIVAMANSTVNVGSTIGNHVIINTNASIDHDCQIGDFVHISPNVALAGNVKVGNGTHIGIGSAVIQGITIGENVVIGAGSVIVRDIPDHGVVFGNPGRIRKYRNE
ncbi:acetyltransferase [Pedobacter sp. MC2016-15]|uniref:acetyltransferase n=1 Tax=Pedobacter sp. MC2016-15 TaxID=2994473 RepID=UPI00224521CA|nr:acetyltransferase [Pedobacter sp. MC2016-15]MCX2481812.1 acetyltransferase [Pedobacter sp. MC2016-15]